MKIVFVLPAITKKIAGGYKIVYEYANRLTERGYKVKIIYDCSNDLKIYSKFQFIIKLYRKILVLIEPKWFTLNRKVEKKVSFNLKKINFSKDNIIFATAVNTAINIHELDIKGIRIFYLIQDYENWDLADEIVDSTYQYNMYKITISKWLQKLVHQKSNQKCIYIPNGIDFNVFHIVNPINDISRKYITFLYHKSERKGCIYAIQIIKKIHEMNSKINFCMFGSVPRGEEIPDYVEYVEKADEKKLLKIYNKTKIFVCTSITEGFGLTGAESMACGAALVTTRTNGADEYAIDGYNSLVSAPRDVEGMFFNIKKLMKDETYRIFIAQNGVNTIRNFSWDNSVDKLVQCIEEEYK